MLRNSMFYVALFRRLLPFQAPLCEEPADHVYPGPFHSNNR
ncbi:hypothetical protein PAECIP111890_05319 [Paenibacillus sp. JJ-223]|nr:hypothetical protein PAECIP111890_05319 [Paenibacillus sp. JJ-223]